jgi:hypothetical protein
MLKDPEFKAWIKCDILKWPHHRSFRETWTEAKKDVMREFLLAANPHTVTISNSGPNMKLQAEELTEFLQSVLGPEIRVLDTKDGDIIIRKAE